MLDNRDNYMIQAENAILQIAVSAVIGDRAEQQDRAGYALTDDGGIAVVCDGMGGLERGKESATLAAGQILMDFTGSLPCGDPHRLLIDSVTAIDRIISDQLQREDPSKHTGTTIVCVIIREDQLFWVSVGDSRIYLYRGGALVRATNDHVFRAVLDRQLDMGAIDAGAYRDQLKYANALVSFLGIGELPYIESNAHPFQLQAGDRILLTSDGLYKSVPDEAIRQILQDNDSPADALNALERRARERPDARKRDNTTVCLINIKQNGGSTHER